MGQREYTVVVERTLRGPASLLWGLLSDTNRWNRFIGMAPTRYRYGTVDEQRHARIGSTAVHGLPMKWEERGEWLEGRYFWGERYFVRALVEKAGLRVWLTPQDDGTTHCRAEAYIAGDGWLAWLICQFWLRRFRTALPAFLDAVESCVGGADAPTTGPAVAAAHIVRAMGGVNPVLDGPMHGSPRPAFQAAAQRFDEAPVDRSVREALVRHVRDRADGDVVHMQPLVLARAWKLPAREVLHAFLYGTEAGLLEMHWRVDCPQCRVASDMAPSLQLLREQVHCDECNISFDVDFEAHVEAVFSANPAVRDRAEVVYCGGTPWVRPHVFAQVRVDPGQSRELDAALPEGRLLVRAPGSAKRSAVRLEAPGGLDVRLTPDGLEATATDAGHILVTNEASHPLEVHVERDGWEADAVRGRMLATLPAFHKLFSYDAPASGAELSIGRMSLMFSDLVGSTDLYKRLGDAAAFAVVQQHFADAHAIVDANGGALVKTMGDAVMASFETPGQAVAAAVALIRSMNRHETPIQVRVGVHDGPCMVVRANERLDFFGTTTNLASRLENAAEGNELVVLQSVAEARDVAQVIQAEGLQPRRFEQAVPGFEGPQACVRLKVGALTRW